MAAPPTDPSFGSIFSSALTSSPGGASPTQSTNPITSIVGSSSPFPTLQQAASMPQAPGGGGSSWTDYLKSAGWLGANLIAPFSAFTPGGQPKLPTIHSLENVGINSALSLWPGVKLPYSVYQIGNEAQDIPGVSGAYDWVKGLLGFGPKKPPPVVPKKVKPYTGPLVGGQPTPTAPPDTGQGAGSGAGDLQTILSALKVPGYKVPDIAMPASGGKGSQITYQQFGYPKIPYQNIPYQTVPGMEDLASNRKLEDKLIASALNIPTSVAAYLPDATKQAIAASSPVIKSILASQAASSNTISEYGQGTEQLLGQLPAQTANDFNNAIAMQGAISQGIGRSLASLNPNAEDQQVLASYGGPQGAQAQVANQNLQAFPGMGKVLTGIGDLGASSLANQKAAAVAFARTLPLAINYQGQQALASLASGTGSDLAKVAQTISTTAGKWAADEASAAAKTAGLRTGVAKDLLASDTATRNRQAGADENTVRTQAAADENTVRTQASSNNAVRAANVSSKNAALSATTSTNNNIRNAQTRVAIAQAGNSVALQKAAAADYYKAAQLQVSAYKATHPNLGAGSVTGLRTIAGNLSKMASGSPGSSSQSVSTNSLTGGSTTSVTKTAGKPGASYGAALAYAQNAVQSIPGATPQTALDMVNTVYSMYGYGGRPLDPPAIQALQAAGLSPAIPPPAIGTDKTPIYYLTREQGLALLNSHTAPPMREYHTSSGKVEYILNVG